MSELTLAVAAGLLALPLTAGALLWRADRCRVENAADEHADGHGIGGGSIFHHQERR